MRLGFAALRVLSRPTFTYFPRAERAVPAAEVLVGVSLVRRGGNGKNEIFGSKTYLSEIVVKFRQEQHFSREFPAFFPLADNMVRKCRGFSRMIFVHIIAY